MFAVIPVQFAFAVHYFVVWPIAATLQCCFPISFPTLPKQVLAVCYILSFCNIFTSCGTLQLICLPFCVTVLYQRRVCGVSLSIPAFRLHCPLSIALYCIALHCIVHLSSSPICSPPLIGRGGLRRNFSFTRFCKYAIGRRPPGVCFGARTDFPSHLFFNICMVEFAFLCFELYCKTSHFLGPVCL